MAIDDVIACYPTLKRLSNAKSLKQRKLILSTAKNCVYKAICEIVHNILIGNIPLSCYRKKQLVKHKGQLRNLTKSKLSLEKKKQIIQKGGFLTTILGAVLPLLTEIVAKKLTK